MNSVADRILGTRAVSGAFTLATARRARVLAYHDVPDSDAFAAQMEWLVRHFTPVTLADILATLRGGNAMPARAVWVTFDDGNPDVVERAQPVLDDMGISATLFVCPGLVSTGAPYWWKIVEQAVAAGVPTPVNGSIRAGSEFVTHLKTLPDAERRTVVAHLEEELTTITGAPPVSCHISAQQLRAWVGAGHSVGNHTWDHPCLDRCPAEVQADQIARADGWLRDAVPGYVGVFAYPNGDWTADAEASLASSGYELAVLFDHRLARRRPARFRVSRLRVAADAAVPRFRAIVSGANPALFGLRRSRAKPHVAE